MHMFETWQLANSKTRYGRYVLFSTIVFSSSRRVERYVEVPDRTSGEPGYGSPRNCTCLKLGSLPTREFESGGMYFFRPSFSARRDESNGMLKYRIGPRESRVTVAHVIALV